MCNQKAALRRKWKEIRASVPEKTEKSRRIQEKLLTHPAIIDAKTVFVYLSFGTEVETLGLIRELLARGKRICVPFCNKETRTMRAVELSDFDRLRPGSYGILEPEPDAGVIPKGEIDLSLVPALAFDKAGYRLGYGGGYYDEFLADFSGKTIGLAFLDCITDRLPREKFDVPVEEVVTE